MRIIVKYLFRLLFILAIGFVVYAVFWDLPPPVTDHAVPVELPAQGQ